MRVRLQLIRLEMVKSLIRKVNLLNMQPWQVGVLYVLLVLLFGLVFWLNPSFWKAELSFVESFYFSVVTITTLGYGDITPQNDLARALTALESLSGIFLIGIFLNSLAQKLTEKENEQAKQREYDRWKPVNGLVIEKSKSTLGLITSAIITIAERKPGAPDTVTHLLGRARYDLDKLQTLVTVNGVGLGSRVLPEIMSLLENYERLINKCEYLIQRYDPKRSKSHFILISPVQDILTARRVISKLMAEHPLIEIGDMPSECSEQILQDTWSKFVQETFVFDAPSEYNSDRLKGIYIFNIETMKQTPLPAGAQVEVYTTFI